MICVVVLLALGSADVASAVIREFGPVFNPENGHWYSMYKTDDETDISWTAAKALAEGEGGYLATLLTAQEDRFVLDAFAGSVISIGVRAWIGLTDINQEGVFEWVTGPEGIQPLTYNHWLPGEPSDSGEDFVEWRNEPNGFGTNQAWNDVSNDAAGMFRFMVEFDSIPPGYVTEEFGPVRSPENGHWYSIYKISDETDVTWTNARALAEGEGGYLATLLTEEEDRFVLDAFAGSAISIGVRAWIGLTDSNQEGVFEWVTGPEGIQPLTYNHWLPGEPSDSGEHFVEWRNEPNGFGTNQSWNDVPNDAAGMFRFMVERDSLPPVAICKNVTVEADPGLCSADASVDDGSFDPDGGSVTLSQTPPGPYPLGETLVVLTVTDDSGLTASCTATVTVVDTQPPVIGAVRATPNVLWPPNHKMVPVEVRVAVSDNCTSNPICMIAAVASNEPVNGPGDGNTSPDWLFTDLTATLRAERSGKGDGRIYTIDVHCTDAAGETSVASVEVIVPHDNGRFKDVGSTHFAFKSIEGLGLSGITSGCSADPPLFCPENVLTRMQMAVLVEKTLGISSPPSCKGTIFADVNVEAVGAGMCAFIEDFAARGITRGCQNDNPRTPQNEAMFCPYEKVTRAQMAVFIERALGVHTPPVCKGAVFQDVKGASVGEDFCGFIEDLAARQITHGCKQGFYCPDDPVTRAQMAVFLDLARLPLLQ